jgi:hypothetical protein
MSGGQFAQTGNLPQCKDGQNEVIPRSQADLVYHQRLTKAEDFDRAVHYSEIKQPLTAAVRA